MKLRERWPATEAVLLSTCNRIELYTASEEDAAVPSHQDVVQFFAEFHGLQPIEVFDDLFGAPPERMRCGIPTVAASLDSMVLGKAQISRASEAGLRIGHEAVIGRAADNQAFQRRSKWRNASPRKRRSTKSGSVSRA